VRDAARVQVQQHRQQRVHHDLHGGSLIHPTSTFLQQLEQVALAAKLLHERDLVALLFVWVWCGAGLVVVFCGLLRNESTEKQPRGSGAAAKKAPKPL
jgi:hypothetical protein